MKYKLYLVECLKINIFISNNIYCIKDFLINLINTFTHIFKYKINIIINVKNYSQFIKYNILAKIIIFILFKFRYLFLIYRIFCFILIFSSS